MIGNSKHRYFLFSARFNAKSPTIFVAFTGSIVLCAEVVRPHL